MTERDLRKQRELEQTSPQGIKLCTAAAATGAAAAAQASAASAEQ